MSTSGPGTSSSTHGSSDPEESKSTTDSAEAPPLLINPDMKYDDLVSGSDHDPEEMSEGDSEPDDPDDHPQADLYDRRPRPGPSRPLRPSTVLDGQRKVQGIDPAEMRARKKGISNEQLYQYMVSRAAKDDEHHAVMRNILSIVKRMEEAWVPTKSAGRSGTFKTFFHH